MTPAERQRMEELKRRQTKVAESRAAATPIVPQGQAAAPGQMGQSQSPLKQIGMQVGKKLLGSALGPLGGVLGGLFNEGGNVPMAQGMAKDPVTGEMVSYAELSMRMQQRRKQRQLQEQAASGDPIIRAKNSARRGPSLVLPYNRNEGGKIPWWKRAWGSQKGKKGSLWDQMGRNMGGPISQNPYGYNEGGSVGETPIKKVMDEQKLDQQAMAFELEQKRKQEAHDMAMKQKQQQFAEAQKMKKQAAMTSKTAAKPKAPLSK